MRNGPTSASRYAHLLKALVRDEVSRPSARRERAKFSRRTSMRCSQVLSTRTDSRLRRVSTALSMTSQRPVSPIQLESARDSACCLKRRAARSASVSAGRVSTQSHEFHERERARLRKEAAAISIPSRLASRNSTCISQPLSPRLSPPLRMPMSTRVASCCCLRNSLHVPSPDQSRRCTKWATERRLCAVLA
eukprot:scaffold14068_cov119-Isochrysis_galbana.AAC.16